MPEEQAIKAVKKAGIVRKDSDKKNSPSSQKNKEALTGNISQSQKQSNHP